MKTQDTSSGVLIRKAFDAVLQNAGVYLGLDRVPGKSRLGTKLSVNTLAPYVLACLLELQPRRYLFVSSGLHRSGRAYLSPRLRDLSPNSTAVSAVERQDINQR